MFKSIHRSTPLLEGHGDVTLKVAKPLGQATLGRGIGRSLQILDSAGPLNKLGLSPGSLHDGETKRHAGVLGVATGDGDDGITSLGSDLGRLCDLRRDEQAGELLALVGQGVVDTLTGRGLAEVEGLPVCLVLLAFALEGGEEAVLA